MLVPVNGRFALKHCLRSRAVFLDRVRMSSSHGTVSSAASDPLQARTSGDIATSLSNVIERITVASDSVGRRSPARLVAVSKTKPAAAVKEAYDAGQRHFGENYVQELVSKAEELPNDIRWHFIGAMQSNKARALVSVPNLFCMESVDRMKTAAALQKAATALDRPDKLQVMVQVNTSGEESKSGCHPDDAAELASYIVQQCDKLQLCGLMTIGAPDTSDEPEAFCILAKARDAVANKIGKSPQNLALSMGMSSDFETAIRMGSDSVRVGSTIFGAREYPALK